MFMGNMLFDFILHPAFVVFVLIALFAAVVALVIAHLLHPLFRTLHKQ